MVSTTGEDRAYFVLDDELLPPPAGCRTRCARRRADRRELRARALHRALHGRRRRLLRAGVTENPVRLTRSVKELLDRVTCGGAPVYVWPGGGITFMVDVTAMPESAFGYVPTPAIVAPIEFTMRRADYAALGGHVDRVRRLETSSPAAARRRAGREPWPPATRRRR